MLYEKTWKVYREKSQDWRTWRMKTRCADTKYGKGQRRTELYGIGVKTQTNNAWSRPVEADRNIARSCRNTRSKVSCKSSPPHKTYDEALHDHRLVTLQQRRNELCNRLFKDIQNSSHRLNSLLPLQHKPGYQLRHSKKYPLPLVKTNRFKSSFINWCLYNCQ